MGRLLDDVFSYWAEGLVEYWGGDGTFLARGERAARGGRSGPTSMSSTVFFPISLKPILSQSGLGIAGGGSARAFLGGASKWGVIFVR